MPNPNVTFHLSVLSAIQDALRAADDRGLTRPYTIAAISADRQCVISMFTPEEQCLCERVVLGRMLQFPITVLVVDANNIFFSGILRLHQAPIFSA
jgi:hypothetical protein